MNIIMMIMMSMSLLFLFLNHPMSMGLMLILQTITIAILTGMMMSTFMLSYILIIIMLSGTLVLFIYMASVASNEKFQTPLKLTITFMMFCFIMNFMIDDLISLENYNLLNYSKEILSLNKLYNNKTMFITIMMMFYLLLSMIAVNNIANISEGPLRMKMNYE